MTIYISFEKYTSKNITFLLKTLQWLSIAFKTEPTFLVLSNLAPAICPILSPTSVPLTTK